MRTSELRGTALDWAVAKCEGWQETRATDATGSYPWLVKEGRDINPKHYRPSTNWALGGPIIEREKISLIYMGFAHEEYWVGSIDAVRREHEMFNGIDLPFEYEEKADTPLIAAMRCYVASKLGNEVQIPAELTL
jgi:hypothetical protein